MENLIARFQHIAQGIFEHLDNKSLVNCREVASSWQKYIDSKNLPWMRIVNIPTIIKELMPFDLEITVSYPIFNFTKFPVILKMMILELVYISPR